MSKDRTTSLTGSTLGDILSRRGLSQSGFARATASSQPYVNMVMNGKRAASPDWIEMVASVTGMTDDERELLHRAAAKDHGFKIDLTKGD